MAAVLETGGRVPVQDPQNLAPQDGAPPSSPRTLVLQKIDDLKKCMEDFGSKLVVDLTDTLNRHTVFQKWEQGHQEIQQQLEGLKDLEKKSNVELEKVEQDLQQALQQKIDWERKFEQRNDAMKNFRVAFTDARKMFQEAQGEYQKQNLLVNELQRKIKEFCEKMRDRDMENEAVRQQNEAIAAQLKCAETEKGQWAAVASQQKSVLKQKEAHIEEQEQQIVKLEHQIQSNQEDLVKIQKQVQNFKNPQQTAKKTSRFTIVLLVGLGIVLATALLFFFNPHLATATRAFLGKVWSTITFSSPRVVA
jgi:chromosome segregation ATPase